MRDQDAGAILAAMAALICIIICIQTCLGRAQDNPEDGIVETGVDPRVTARQDPALLLAQGLVAEAGWTVHGDQAAILHVLKRRSTLPAFRRNDGLRPEVRVALSYVRAFNPRGQRSERQRRMIALDWPLLEARAPGVVAVVRQWMAGTLADPCLRPAWHWGSSIDTHGTALPRVDCGRCTNIYLGRLESVPVRALPGSGVLPASLARGRF